MAARTTPRGGDGRHLALDLGASGGRVVQGTIGDDGRIAMEEIHRFPNGPVRVAGRLHWDVLRLWSEVQEGVRAAAARPGPPLSSLAVDTWGVDFGLLDRAGRLLGNPVHYRDGRTDGVVDEVLSLVPHERLYRSTGIQIMQINTLYQLRSMVTSDDPHLDAAQKLLFVPDLLHYWFTGEAVAERTIASTSQMLAVDGSGWCADIVRELGIPTRLLPRVVPSGTSLGPPRDDVARELRLTDACEVIAVASHDTADAIAAIPDLDSSSVFLSSGTWSLMGVETSAPVVSEEARRLNLTNEAGVHGTTRLLKNVAGLWLLQECRRAWRSEGHDLGWPELLDAAAKAPPLRSFVNPGAETFLNPPHMPDAIRDACRDAGQPVPSDVGAVVRCCLESLALGYRQVLEGLERVLDRRLARIHVVGGGSRNTLLNQFTADACDRPVVVGPVEATAIGSVMLQAVATGRIADLASGRRHVATSVERTFLEPRDPGAWDEAYARFLASGDGDPHPKA